MFFLKLGLAVVDKAVNEISFLNLSSSTCHWHVTLRTWPSTWWATAAGFGQLLHLDMDAWADDQDWVNFLFADLTDLSKQRLIYKSEPVLSIFLSFFHVLPHMTFKLLYNMTLLLLLDNLQFILLPFSISFDQKQKLQKTRVFHEAFWESPLFPGTPWNSPPRRCRWVSTLGLPPGCRSSRCPATTSWPSQWRRSSTRPRWRNAKHLDEMEKRAKAEGTGHIW